MTTLHITNSINRSPLRLGFVLITLAAMLSNCTYGDRASYETHGRQPTYSNAIEVVESRNTTRPYKVVGVVSSDSYYMSSAMKRCRSEAAKLGADALLDFGPSGNQTGVATYLGYGVAMGASYNTSWSAKAIVWER